MKVECERLQTLPADDENRGKARLLALDCMSKALEYLDSDPGISPIVGSQLQLAIDRLSAPVSRCP